MLNQNGAFDVSTADALTNELQCSVTIGDITCEKIGVNTWTITLNNTSNNGTMVLTLTDQIGNLLQTQTDVFVDVERPECSYPGIIKYPNLYVQDLNIFSVGCRDSQSQIIMIEIFDGASTHSVYDLNNLTVQLLNGSNIEIRAVDYFGNSFSLNLTVILDNQAPEVKCTYNGRELDFSTSNYVRFSSTVLCEINDQLSTKTSVSMFIIGTNISTVLYNSSTDLNLFDAVLGVQPDQTRNILGIHTEDSLGNLQSVFYQIIVDDVAPVLQLTSRDSANITLLNSNIFHSNGSYQVTIDDNNNIESSAILVCESGMTIQSNFSKSLFLIPDIDRGDCGQFVTISVDSYDAAGNYVSIEEQIFFDYSAPGLEIYSSCPIQANGLSVLLVTCTLQIASSDDTSSSTYIQVYLGVEEIGSSTSTFDLNLFLIPENVITEVSVIITDEANRQSLTTFRIKIQPILYVDISRETCTQINITCGSNEQFSFDYLITGAVEIDLEIPPEENSVSIKQSHGVLCPVNQNLSCISITQFPFSLNPDIEGYWVLNYSSIDDLGREYRSERTLLIELNEIQILSMQMLPDGKDAAEESVLACGTCALLIEVKSGHKPLLNSNADSYTITQSSDSVWLFLISLNSSSLSKTASSLNVEFVSANNIMVPLQFNLTFIGIHSINPRLSDNTPCIDNPQILVDYSTNNSDFLCLFDSPEANLIDFYLDLDIGQESSIRIEVTQHFAGQIRSASDYVFSSTQGIHFPLQILRDGTGVPMDYEIKIYTEYHSEPLEFTIALFNSDEFTLDITPDTENSSITIEEAGDVEIKIWLDVDVSLAGEADLNAEHYLELLKKRLGEGNCSIHGKVYEIHSDTLGDYSRSTITDRIDCTIIVEIVNGRIKMTLTENWATKSTLPVQGNNGIYYLFDVKHFNIEYVVPITKFNGTITISKIENDETNKNFILEPDFDTDDKSTANSSSCANIENDTKIYFNEKINTAELMKCLKGLGDEDGLYSSGIRLIFELDGSDDKTIDILCNKSNYFDGTLDLKEWLDDIQKENKCVVSKESEEIDYAVSYRSIKLTLITCDLRCNYGSSIPEEIDDFEIKSMDSSFSNPGTNALFIQFGLVLLCIIASFVLVARFKDSGIRSWFKELRIMTHLRQYIDSLGIMIYLREYIGSRNGNEKLK